MKRHAIFNLRVFSSIFRRSIFMPNNSYKDINDIDILLLKKKGIKGIIFDIDQTLFYYRTSEMPKHIRKKFFELQKNFKCCALSNYHKGREREKEIENKYKITVIRSKIKKPDPLPYRLCMKEMETKNNETVMVGNCHITDIIGANLLNIYTIKIKSFMKRTPLWVKILCFIENVFYSFYKSTSKPKSN